MYKFIYKSKMLLNTIFVFEMIEMTWIFSSAGHLILIAVRILFFPVSKIRYFYPLKQKSGYEKKCILFIDPVDTGI